jgi:hypothetical protein
MLVHALVCQAHDEEGATVVCQAHEPWRAGDSHSNHALIDVGSCLDVPGYPTEDPGGLRQDL